MKKILLMCAVALGLGATVASAAPVLACAGGGKCNGVQLGAEFFDLGSNRYQIDVAFDFTGYVGNTTDRLRAVAISGFLPGNTALTETYGIFDGTLSGGTFSGPINVGLGADGCGGGQNGLCMQADGATNGAVLFEEGTGAYTQALFSFFFTTTGTVATDTVHIKYQYINKDGKNVLDLGSFDQPYRTTCLDDEADCAPRDVVPEPTSLALLGLALLGAGIARRRK